MKKLQAFIPVLILALILSGCSFRLFSTAEELIYPVSPSGENANVQKALDTYFKNGYSLKTPISGEYKTSYIFYDIQKDTKFQNKNKITKVVSFILHRVVYEGEIINYGG